MKNFYVISLSLKEDGDVLFSPAYLTFNEAKKNIENFLDDFSTKRGKKLVFLSKDEMEKLKLQKRPDDNIYVRKRTSEATLYHRNTLLGYISNSYSIEKLGKLSVNEFVVNSVESVCKEESVKSAGVEKLSHGVHVNLISELKSVLSSRQDKTIQIEKKEKGEDPFILALRSRKETLKNITPPPPRKVIV